MKNNLLVKKLAELLGQNMILAVAAACGFWASQFLAWNYVGSELGNLPKIAGVLSFVALGLFFIVRVCSAWSRLPSILGLCSSGLLLFLFVYLNWFKGTLGFIGLFMSLSVVLAFAGVLIDVKRCWHRLRGARAGY
jgi:hypothetical protein